MLQRHILGGSRITKRVYTRDAKGRFSGTHSVAGSGGRQLATRNTMATYSNALGGGASPSETAAAAAMSSVNLAREVKTPEARHLARRAVAAFRSGRFKDATQYHGQLTRMKEALKAPKPAGPPPTKRDLTNAGMSPLGVKEIERLSRLHDTDDSVRRSKIERYMGSFSTDPRLTQMAVAYSDGYGKFKARPSRRR